MSVYLPKKSPFFAYDFQFKGQRYHGSTGEPTLRKAEAVERRIRSEVAQGTHGDGSSMTLDEAAGRWWEEVGRHRASAYQLEHRLAIAVRLIGPRTRIHDIQTRQVSIAIEKRRGEHYVRAHAKAATGNTAAVTPARHELKNATVNADVAKPLQRVLNRARKTWGIKNLPEIDWAALTLPEAESEIRLYSLAQQQAWLDACDPTARFALRLLLTYGLRLGELFFPLDAFVPDTPEGASLAINKRKKGSLYLPLRDDDARQIAARVSGARAGKLDTIWYERAGLKLEPVSYAALKSRLHKAGKRAGLTMPRLVHGIRHHVGTTNLAETGDLRMTQQLLGHADIKSTVRYAHALNAGLRAALNSRNSPGASEADDQFVVQKQKRTRRSF